MVFLSLLLVIIYNRCSNKLPFIAIQTSNSNFNIYSLHLSYFLLSATPWCYYSGQDSSAVGYSLSQMTETETGYHGTLNLRSSSQWSTSYGADIATLSLDIVFETADTVRVRITDATKARWEVSRGFQMHN